MYNIYNIMHIKNNLNLKGNKSVSVKGFYSETRGQEEVLFIQRQMLGSLGHICHRTFISAVTEAKVPKH